MELFWTHWQRPLWLLLLPLGGWLLWHLHRREQRLGHWQRLLPAAFQPWLLSPGQTRQRRLPWLLLGLGWLLAVLALLGPSWQRLEQPAQKPADPLVVILQLTPALLAEDVRPSRLEHARRKLSDLLQARQDAQTGIVLYAGSAHVLLPLSDDLGTAENLLNALHPELMPRSGQRAELAVDEALTLLEHAGQGRGRLLLVTAALDIGEQAAIRARLGRDAPPLAILGIGTAQGAPVRLADGSFLKDADGSILIPQLDADGLQAFATSLGGQYHSATLDDRDLQALDLFGSLQRLRSDSGSTRLAAWDDQGHWLLLPLLLLAASAARRGWLLALLLLVNLPQQALALSWDDLWQRPDQQGLSLLQAGRPAAAAERFEDPQWQAEALYRAGDYPAAAERFALDPSARGHYNRGNALARSGALEAALDAYEQALEHQTEFPQAQHNKALVEQLLRQQAARPAPPQPPEPERDNPQDGPGTALPDPGNAVAQQPQPGRQTLPASSAEAGPQQPATAPSQPSGERQQPGDSPPPDASPAEPRQQPARPIAPGNLEQRQALEHWLREIPDDPAQLLRRKFLYQQQYREEHTP